ncbi:hypothetical protein [Agrobacterium rosae]|uniref:Uncharacterized protein n=1 Tax=Agrobacterium rosae TaxID=1972867 RepID=A0AAW9FGX9_9HYPH|nr:hypothetical protein [Agrobacterium rosae]MDX8305867.1 hypothetical protein [Agrobacterium rosae]
MRICATITALALLATPAIAGASDTTLDGHYAAYRAKTTTETDRGPRNDEDCRRFFASELFETRYKGEDLNISGNRWEDNMDVSAVTGTVVLQKSKGGGIPFTINRESEGDSGPAKGTVKRVGRLGLSFAFSGERVLYYCKMDG